MRSKTTITDLQGTAPPAQARNAAAAMACASQRHNVRRQACIHTSTVTQLCNLPICTGRRFCLVPVLLLHQCLKPLSALHTCSLKPSINPMSSPQLRPNLDDCLKHTAVRVHTLDFATGCRYCFPARRGHRSLAAIIHKPTILDDIRASLTCELLSTTLSHDVPSGITLAAFIRVSPMVIDESRGHTHRQPREGAVTRVCVFWVGVAESRERLREETSLTSWHSVCEYAISSSA